MLLGYHLQPREILWKVKCINPRMLAYTPNCLGLLKHGSDTGLSSTNQYTDCATLALTWTDFPCPGRYFQTRHYRAPEVILDLDYDTAADMWSVGVILAELYLDKVPFYGETTTDQLAAIMEVMGLVPPHMVAASPQIGTYQSKFWLTQKCRLTKLG